MAESSKQDFNEKTKASETSGLSPVTKQMIRRVAVKVVQEFPDILENLMIISAPVKPAVIFATTSAAERIKNNMPAMRQFVKDQRYSIHNAAAVAFANHKLGGKITPAIAINDERERSLEKTLYILLHEIGHIVTRNGHTDDRPHLNECAADAFATLVHLQKFGRDATTALYMKEQVAITCILSSWDHYTSGAIQQALDFADKMGQDFSKLSLRALAEHAAQIAESASKSPVIDIYVAYEPAQRAWYMEGGYKKPFVEKIMDVMNKHQGNPDIVLAGKRALAAPEVAKILTAEAANANAPAENVRGSASNKMAL